MSDIGNCCVKILFAAGYLVNLFELIITTLIESELHNKL